MKYHDWLKKWLAYYVRPYVKERTYQKYQSQARLHIAPVLGMYEMEKLTATVLQKFVVSLTDKGLAANSVGGVVTVLKLSLKKAVAFGIVKKQYSESIQRPKGREKQVDCFSHTEQRKMEVYISEKNKPKLFGVVVCLYTGVRIGELLALEWTDIDWKNGFMYISKSCHDVWGKYGYEKAIDTPKTEASVRIIPLSKPIFGLLKYLKKEAHSKYVVGNERVHGVSVRSYQKTFERLLQRLKIPHKGFHALRHTFATRALECGMDVKTLSELLGHNNPTITLKRYAHSMMEHKQAMMNRLYQWSK